eukprot:ANDGO_03343.mRNA.1 hypothetical protein
MKRFIFLAVLVTVVGILPAVLALQDVDSDYDNSAYLGATLNVPTPRVTKVVPSDGPASGRALLTIWGTDFRYTQFLSCRFAEGPSYKGMTWSVPAVWVSEAMITCVTPDFVYSAKKTTGYCIFSTGTSSFTDTLRSNATYCDEMYITVTNDGQIWSGYLSSGSGSYLKYRIFGSATLPGTLAALNLAGSSSSVNTTFPAEGATTLTIQYTRASLTQVPFRDASHVYCYFYSAAPALLDKTIAKWVKDTSSLVSVWTCLSGTASMVTGTIKLGYEIDATPTRSLTTNTIAFTVTSALPASIKISTRDDLVTNISSNVGSPIPYLQRAPMWGNTELTVRGQNLYPSNKAYCVFQTKYTSPASIATCDTANSWVLCGTKCCFYSWASYSEPSSPAHALDPLTNNVGYYRCMTPRHRDQYGYDEYEPSVLTDVFLSLVDKNPTGDFASMTGRGLSYSAENARLNDLRISDIYVDTSGSDYDLDASEINGGDGSPHKPYRTIQRALDRALINCRNPSDCANGPYGLMHGQPSASGSLQQFNRDLIIVKPGYYRGPGNSGLKTRGKLVTIRSQNLHAGPANAGSNGLATTVDCQNNGLGFLDESGQRYWDNDDNTERDSIYVQGIAQKNCFNKRSYSVYDYKNKKYTTHRNPMVAYHQSGVGAQKKPVFPYANRQRLGYQA